MFCALCNGEDRRTEMGKPILLALKVTINGVHRRKGESKMEYPTTLKASKGKVCGFSVLCSEKGRIEIGKLILVNSKYSLTGVQRQRDGRD